MSELDDLIAEKIMGWHVGDEQWFVDAGNTRLWRKSWLRTTDLAQSADALRVWGGRLRQRTANLHWADERWYAVLYDGPRMFTGLSESLSAAICEALGKAVTDGRG